MSSDDFLTDLDRGCAPGKAGPDLFFSDFHEDREKARRICHGCPRRTDCLTYAVDRNQTWGIWGGVLMSSRVEAHTARLATPDAPAEPVRARQVNLSREKQKERNEAGVRRYWLQEKSDLEIALALDITYGAVAHIRRRLGLPAIYGPGGRRLPQAVSA